MSNIYDSNQAVFKCHHLVMAMVDLAKQRGIHPDKLLKGSRLFYHDLIREHSHISYVQLEKVVQNLVKHTQGDASFLLGRRLFPSHLNEIAPVLLNCESLASLIRVITCYQTLFFPFINVQQVTDNNNLYFLPWHTMSVEHNEVSQFLLEVWLGLVISVLKWRLGYVPDFHYAFVYEQPRYVEQYHAHLPGNLQFAQPLTLFRCDLSISALRFAESNISLKRHYLSQLSTDKEQSLLQYLTLAIAKGRVQSLEQASEILKMSPATLKRKLKTFNCSFQKLHDSVRQRQAIFQISTLGYTNERVAEEMSYSDITNFRRAFKRWTGMTPSDLRQLYSNM